MSSRIRLNQFIESLVPHFSESSKADMKVFMEFMEFYKEELFNYVLLNSDNPRLNNVLGSLPKEILHQQQLYSDKVQRLAVFEDDWEPFIENLVEQGGTYAHMGLSFSVWSDLTIQSSNFLLGKLKDHYGDSISESMPCARGIKIFFDFTLKVLAESFLFFKSETIVAQEQYLNALIRENKQLITIASHNLQEPLNKLQSLLFLILEEPISEEGKTDIHDSITTIHDLRELIFNLMEYTRIGYMSEYKSINLNPIITELKKEFSGFPIKYGPMPSNVFVYPVEFKLLIHHLLSNAVKFGDKKRNLEVSFQAKKTKDGWSFIVSDNGIGIAQKDHEKVFSFFKRLHQQKDKAGQGLGLAMSKKIADLHQGKLELKSELDKGSTFIFSIPLKIETLLKNEKA
jgi:signal transduction histidine kinase